MVGGRGLTWRSGHVVVRPVGESEEATWKSQVLTEIDRSEEFTFPRPIRDDQGNWVHQGWQAIEWIPGIADETRAGDIVRAGEAFHRAIAGLARPVFITESNDPWSKADRIAWGEATLPADEDIELLVAEYRAVNNWAYPATSMSVEETAFAMTAGVMGRLYLSGFLGELDAEQFALVREAVVLHSDWRHRIAEAHPVWPLDLPGWEDDVIALQLDAGSESLLALWSRGVEAEITLAGVRGRTVEQVYPVALPQWKIRMDEDLPVIEDPAGPAARIFAVR